MQIDTRKLKKLIIKAVPYVAFSYVGNLIGFAYRTAEGDGFQEKILPFMSNLGVAFARIFPSLHPLDILFGLVLAGVMRLVLYIKSKNKKKFRQGEEYGSAVWGGEKDIEPYMDLSCPENNVILTRTESLTMGKPSAPKFARNKNILWVKAEKLLYTAYIALIFAMYPEDQWNFETLIDMINNSECREDDEEFKNAIDIEFEIVECWLNGTKHEDPEVMADYGDIFETKPDAEQRRLGAFALKQFKAYKLAAGKTAKSILISCSTRLAPFAIDEVLEITSYDELHLDKLGDELSALFIIISDTDATFNFLVAIMYSQLFKRIVKEHDADLDITGIRQAEGGIRSAAFKTCFSECKSKGCNTFRPIFWYTDGDKRDYEEMFGVTHSRCYTEYGLRRTGCVGCPFSKHITEELAIIEEHEPNLYKAAVHIFGKSYEYTAKYRAFVKEMKAKEKEEKNRDRLLSLNGTSSCDTGGDSGACSPDRSAVSADNNAPEIAKGA